MNPGVDVISVFEKKNDENGTEFFTGTIDLKALKKIKADELRVVMMPGDLLPPSLLGLMGKSEMAMNGLFMFMENKNDSKTP